MNSKATKLYNLASELRGYADNYEHMITTSCVDPDLTIHYRDVIRSLRIKAVDILIQVDAQVDADTVSITTTNGGTT